jgi:hypothetical protein
MNSAMNYSSSLDEDSRVVLLNALKAECVPEGHNGMKSVSLHDEDGMDVGTLFYNMAVEEFAGRRILYVDPVHIHTAPGCSRRLAESIAKTHLDSVIARALKTGAQPVTYVTCGVAPADDDLTRFWKSFDAWLRELAERSRQVFRLEELPAREERARAARARSLIEVDALE